MLSKEETLLIIYFIAIIFFLVVFVVVFFIAFQHRKNKFLKERYEVQQRYQRELADSQIEIQEQTLKNIAWELHDNVGQLLSVANLQLNVLSNVAPSNLLDQINDTKSVVRETILEIRSLSKVLNNDVVLKNGLIATLNVEIDRFKRLGYLDSSMEIYGDIVPLNSANEIIIFRILQEFFSNVLKHARASKLFVHLDYKEQFLEIKIEDDGIGFDPQQKTDSSGMETMRSRARLLNAEFSLISAPGDGTRLILKYPYKNK